MYYGQIIHENNKLQKFMCNIRIGMEPFRKSAWEPAFLQKIGSKEFHTVKYLRLCRRYLTCHLPELYPHKTICEEIDNEQGRFLV